MTKVGVYAVLRVSTLLFGAQGGALAAVTAPWLEVLALATLALGSIAAVASHSLRALVANLVVASAGTLLLAVALARPEAAAAGLLYLVNSTLAVAALFLLADRVRAARGEAGDEMVAAPFGPGRASLGSAYFVLAVAIVGLPPLAGFMGKALLLAAAGAGPRGAVVAAVVLGSSLLALIAVARSGSMLFWKPAADAASAPRGAAAPPRRAPQSAALGLLLALIVACAVFAGPLSRWSEATAAQLFDPAAYRAAVFGAQPVAPAWNPRAHPDVSR
jgi:multicomponent K+:H+ antiporter subunit D